MMLQEKMVLEKSHLRETRDAQGRRRYTVFTRKDAAPKTRRTSPKKSAKKSAKRKTSPRKTSPKPSIFSRAQERNWESFAEYKNASKKRKTSPKKRKTSPVKHKAAKRKTSPVKRDAFSSIFGLGAKLARKDVLKGIV